MDDLEDGEIEFKDSLACEHEQRRLEREMRKKQKKLNKASQKVNKQLVQAPTGSAASHLQHHNQGLVTKPGYFNIYGLDARASVEVKEKEKPIRLADVQGLVLWVLAEYTSPRWAFVKNKPLIDRVVLVLANGISADLFKKKQELLPSLRLLGDPALVIGLNAQAKPSQTTSALLNTSVARKRKGAPGDNKNNSNNGNNQEGGTKRQKGLDGGSVPPPPFPPSHYLLTVKEMESSNYPLPQICGDTGELLCPDGFVPTQPYAGKGPRRVLVLKPTEDEADARDKHGGKRQKSDSRLVRSGGSDGEPQEVEGASTSPRGKEKETAKTALVSGVWEEVEVGEEEEERMVGLDCEMCITAEGFELTRATLVDRQGRLLMDELCVPDNPITDYNTRYSGITAEMLADCPNRLSHIQEKIRTLVSAETLLVGHSLDNDLQALKMVHSRILDTAHLYPHPRGPPFKSALKVLASKFLKRRIQDGSHDSAIDARAAMDLVLLKIKHGPWFGTNEGNNLNMNKLTDVISDHGTRSCLIDRKDTLTRYATGSTDALPVYTDDDAAHMGAIHAASGSRKGQLVWVQFTDLSTFYFRRAQFKRSLISQAQNGKAGPSSSGLAEPDSKAASAPPSAVRADSDGKAEKGADVKAETAGGVKEEEEEDGEDVAARETAASCSAQCYDQNPDSAKTEEFSDESEEQVVKQLNSHVGKLWQALPANTMMILITGQGDTPEVRRLQESRYRRLNGLDGLPPWSFADENDLKAAMEREITGLCFCAVKQ